MYTHDGKSDPKVQIPKASDFIACTYMYMYTVCLHVMYSSELRLLFFETHAQPKVDRAKIEGRSDPLLSLP